MRKWCLILLLPLILTGCSGSSDSSVRKESLTVQETDSMDFNGVGSDSSIDSSSKEASSDAEMDSKTEVEEENRMLVYWSTVSIDSLDYEESVDSLKDVLSEVKGYTESENFSDGGSSYDYYYVEESEKHREYQAVLRVPSSKYEDFLTGLESIGDVRSLNSSVEDETETYMDAKTALKIYQEQEKRLVDRIASADDSYALQLESELTELEIKIAQLKRQMQDVENDVAYSTVDITIREVKEYSLHDETNTFPARLEEAVFNSLDNFCSFLEWLLMVVIYGWYYAIIIFVIIWFIRRRRKKKRQKETTPFRMKIPDRDEQNNKEE